MSKPTALVTSASVLGTFLVAVGAQLLGAGAAYAGCAPDPSQLLEAGAVSYTAISPATGERNTGNKAVTFHETLSIDTTASTTVSAHVGFDVDAGIASVKADLGVSVTKTYHKGQSVTAPLVIPAHNAGSIQAKAQFTRFNRYHTQTAPTCHQDTTLLGYMRGITKVPYFSTCIGSDTCVPRP